MQLVAVNVTQTAPLKNELDAVYGVLPRSYVTRLRRCQNSRLKSGSLHVNVAGRVLLLTVAAPT